MEESNSRDESVNRKNELLSLMNKTDKLTLNPEERAAKVYRILKSCDLDNWDIICFCAEYLGSQVSVHPWLEQPVKHVTRLVYTAHYSFKEWEGK